MNAFLSVTLWVIIFAVAGVVVGGLVAWGIWSLAKWLDPQSGMAFDLIMFGGFFPFVGICAALGAIIGWFFR